MAIVVGVTVSIFATVAASPAVSRTVRLTGLEGPNPPPGGTVLPPGGSATITITSATSGAVTSTIDSVTAAIASAAVSHSVKSEHDSATDGPIPPQGGTVLPPGGSATITISDSPSGVTASPPCTSTVTVTYGVYSDGGGGQEFKLKYDTETVDCFLLQGWAACSVDGGNKQFNIFGSYVDLGGTSIADCTGGTIVPGDYGYTAPRAE
jgi:hypothetical protein